MILQQLNKSYKLILNKIILNISIIININILYIYNLINNIFFRFKIC